jgi:hypothetical protein
MGTERRRRRRRRQVARIITTCKHFTVLSILTETT